MKLQRRQFLRLAGNAAGFLLVSRNVWAQTYPARPVHLVVGFPAGGAADIVARVLAQWLSDRLGQQFIVENRPGAGTNIATEAVVRATADGYTLLYATSPNAINATLYDKLNFNFVRDIAPVASVNRTPLVVVVNASSPAKTVPEFITYAKANPGKINMASSGIGTPGHVAGELFKMMAGVDIVHVPYRGAAPALTDLVGGQVQVYFGPMPASIESIRNGQLRALAVTTTTRSEAIPDLPPMADFLPGYEASTWFGIGAPRNTPSAIVDTLNTGINAALTDPKIKARLSDLGATIFSASPADFAKFVADETEKWAKVIKFAGLKQE
jgi:tripartite-type tricarboxylate transporter receptor subunit TctC